MKSLGTLGPKDFVFNVCFKITMLDAYYFELIYFSRWLKPVKVHELKFVSKDVLVIHVGKTLIFYNVKTLREDLLVVGGNKSISFGGDSLPLDGIGCVDCCGIDLLALAEQSPIAKVIICRYPDFKVIATLTGKL
jgi:hypothetical protein